MAISGNGTQQDPWVPTNWSELKSLLLVSSRAERCYISLPKNSIYDLNVEEPGGLTEMLYLNNTVLYGNNSKILNMNISPSTPSNNFYISDSSIYNLDILNMYNVMVDSNSRTGVLTLYGNTFFIQCRISGYSAKRPLILNNTTSPAFIGCSINVKLPDNTSGLFACESYSVLSFYHSHINMIGDGYVGSYQPAYYSSAPVKLIGSKITGNGSLVSLNNQSAFNVIDMDYLNKFDCDVSANGVTLVNSETTRNWPLTVIDSVYRRTAPTDMRSETFLNNIGFPIGDDQNE